MRPLLDAACPGLDHAAALLGWGSEVLGFDSPRSTDHNWGPRLQILADTGTAELGQALETGLPESFRGYPVCFPASQDPAATPRHWVEVATLPSFLKQMVGFDAAQAVSVPQWLATPTQRLAEFTGGEVFHDGPGELTLARARLAWYPAEVWRYVLACQWQRIAQEEAFPGRCAEAGDELGAAVVAGRLARDLMRLCLLMDRRYPPYSKWLGSAFGQLPAGKAIGSALSAALAATDARAREEGLVRAMELAAARHNELGLTDPLDPRTRPYYDRPFQVLDADRFASALLATVTDPDLRRRLPVGAVDQFVDSTDALGSEAVCHSAVEHAYHTPIRT